MPIRHNTTAPRSALWDNDHTGNLDDLDDVTITTPDTGATIVWNGSAWVDGDHGDLHGLGDDDHPQYTTEAEVIAIVTPAYFLCDSVALTAGTVGAGDHTTVHVRDATYLQIDEVGGSPPAIVAEFAWSGLTSFNKVMFHGYYTGNHDVLLQIYDYDLTAWETLATIPQGSSSPTAVAVDIADPDPHISAGAALVRLYHADTGNASHDLFVDWLVLSQAYGASGGSIDHGELAGLTDDDHPQYIKDAEFTAAGDVLVGSGVGTFAPVGVGSETEVWTVVSGAPAWAAAPAGVTSHDALDDVSADDHHAQSHAHDGVDGSGTVSHGDLTDIGADDHHAEAHDLSSHTDMELSASVTVDTGSTYDIGTGAARVATAYADSVDAPEVIVDSTALTIDASDQLELDTLGGVSIRTGRGLVGAKQRWEIGQDIDPVDAEALQSVGTDAHRVYLYGRDGYFDGDLTVNDVVAEADSTYDIGSDGVRFKKVWADEIEATTYVGVSGDHGGLTGLTDDDHLQYALMASQASAPADPARDTNALWYDTDASYVDDVVGPFDGDITFDADATYDIGETATRPRLVYADNFDTHQGLKFPASQNASSDANTFDDYQEDTWTPALTPASGSEAYISRSGWYTKAGRLVVCHFDIILNGTGSMSGAVKLTGLPFTVGNGYSAGNFSYLNSMALSCVEPSLHAVIGTTRCDLFYVVYSGTRALAYLDSSQFSNVINEIIGTVSYHV